MATSPSGLVAVGALPADPPGAVVGAGAPQSRFGNALHAAIGAWLVGANAGICAAIDPALPTFAIGEIARTGIDLSWLRQPSDSSTTSPDLEPATDQLADISHNWSVHLCGLTPERQRDMARAVLHRVASLTIDAAYPTHDILPDETQLIELATACDAIVLGRREVEELWPGQAPRVVLRQLSRRGVRTALIRLGGGAAIGVRESAFTWMPEYPLGVWPTTPARDAYAGAFGAAFAVDRNLRRAMASAAAAASVVAESHSPLQLISDYSRLVVEARARQLEIEALDNRPL